jgi:hypothetical protein
MDFLKTIFDYFTDGPTRFLRKLLFFIFIVIGLFIFDKSLNFTFHYDNSKKIEEIKEINLIIRNNKISSLERKNLEKMKIEIFNRKRLFDFSLKDQFNIDLESKTDSRNKYIHFITSSWFWLMVMFILPLFFFIKSSHRESRLETLLIVLFIFEPLLFALAVLTSFLCEQIHNFDNPIWNYLINFSITMVFLLFFKSVRSEINKKVNENK